MITDEIADEVRRLELATRRLVRDLSAGDYASAFRGRGIEFLDVREYQPGDDVRTIDWRVTARLGNTYLRRHHEERELTVMLLVDESASAQVGSRRRTRAELSAQVAAVLALTAARANDRVGAAFFSDGLGRVIQPKKGRRHALRVLAELLTARATGTNTDLAAALEALEPMLPRRVVLVILSDFYTSGFQLPLARLARKHEVICMQLRDPIEQALPSVGLIRLRDPESGVIMTVDASDPAVRNRVAERRATFDTTLTHDLYASGAELVRLDASGDFGEPLVAFFRRRARA
jgi:uncharacterized protein (DUF58 family)